MTLTKIISKQIMAKKFQNKGFVDRDCILNKNSLLKELDVWEERYKLSDKNPNNYKTHTICGAFRQLCVTYRDMGYGDNPIKDLKQYRVEQNNLKYESTRIIKR